MGGHTDRGAAAIRAAQAVATRLDIECDRARILKDSNNTIVHLSPAPLIAKVGTTTIRSDAAMVLARELAVGAYLAENGAPIAPPASEVPAGPHVENNVVITLWTYVEPSDDQPVSDSSLGEMLTSFHRAFADYRDELPDFSENVGQAKRALHDHAKTTRLRDEDRGFLLQVATEITTALAAADLERHPLHGDPHLDGNILQSKRGPLLVDFEAACLGPYEWDLTALPRARSAYPRADPEVLALLSRMRSLVVSTWCWMQYGRAAEVDEGAHVHLAFLRSDPN